MADPGYQDEKKSDDEKSMTFTIRLHPESKDPAEVELVQKFLSLKNGKGSIRRFVVDLYRQRERLPEKDKPMPIVDTRKIMDKLDKVLSYLKNMKAGAVVNETASVPDTEYSDDWLSTLDRYLDAGLSDEGESLEYYDEDES